MATKKAGSAAKKTTTKVKSTTATKPSTTTKVTTVKAVETAPRTVSRKNIDWAAVARVLVAEFIGTFILAAAYIITKGEPLYLGFTLIAIILTLGTVSGAHVNPLLTVGAWVTRKITSLRALGYIAAQILGAVAALGLLTTFIGGAPHAATPDAQSAAMGAAQQTPELFKVAAVAGGKEFFVFFAELVGATLFAVAVATAQREKKDRVAAAFTIGFGLFVAALFAGVAASYVSANAIINPAIALSVGAIDWGKFNLWAAAIYLVAPLLGGVIGYIISDALRADRPKDEV